MSKKKEHSIRGTNVKLSDLVYVHADLNGIIAYLSSICVGQICRAAKEDSAIGFRFMLCLIVERKKKCLMVQHEEAKAQSLVYRTDALTFRSTPSMTEI